MSTFVMTYRTADGLRLQPLLAHTLATAWDRAFDVVERMGCAACSFGVHRAAKG